MKYSHIYYLGALVVIPAFAWKKAAYDNNKVANGNKVITPAVVEANPSTETGLAKVITLANAFKATLDTKQVALLQLTYAKSTAIRWSNFPQEFSHPNRLGLNLGSLNEKQMAAFKTLMSAVLDTKTTNEGLSELEGVLAADDYLGKATGKPGTFGSGNYYIAFLGEPSSTGLWELQYGGHHFAFANTYNKGDITGTTPSFRGVEPMKPVTANGKTYQPMVDEQNAFAALIKSLNAADITTAKLNTTFNDVLLGPGADGQFPQKKQGLKLSALTAAQKQLVTKAMAAYVSDLDAVTAKTILDKYIAELPDTYLVFAGSGAMDQSSDYIRLDGPSIWLEYSVQPSRDFPGTTHPHSVWRDRKNDYGGN